MVLPWVVSITFPVYFHVAGVLVANLHALLVTVWAVLLTNLLLIRFRKLPFTCSFPVFKQHSIVILIAFCFGFLIYAVSTPDFESAALLATVANADPAPGGRGGMVHPTPFGEGTVDVERRLIFEESGTRAFEVLHLG